VELLRAMRLRLVGFICTGFIAGLLLPANAQVPEMPQAVRTKIESILGAKGTYVPDEGAFKLRFPRRDILRRMRRQHGYAAFPPESWAAFGPAVKNRLSLLNCHCWRTKSLQHAMVEGEFAATESEQPVLNALRSRNFKFISIRNHTLGEHRQLIFVRYTADGPAAKLAEAVRHVLNVQVGVVEPHT